MCPAKSKYSDTSNIKLHYLYFSLLCTCILYYIYWLFCKQKKRHLFYYISEKKKHKCISSFSLIIVIYYSMIRQFGKNTGNIQYMKTFGCHWNCYLKNVLTKIDGPNNFQLSLFPEWMSFHLKTRTCNWICWKRTSYIYILTLLYDSAVNIKFPLYDHFIRLLLMLLAIPKFNLCCLSGLMALGAIFAKWSASRKQPYWSYCSNCHD